MTSLYLILNLFDHFVLPKYIFQRSKNPPWGNNDWPKTKRKEFQKVLKVVNGSYMMVCAWGGECYQFTKSHQKLVQWVRWAHRTSRCLLTALSLQPNLFDRPYLSCWVKHFLLKKFLPSVFWSVVRIPMALRRGRALENTTKYLWSSSLLLSFLTQLSRMSGTDITWQVLYVHSYVSTYNK